MKKSILKKVLASFTLAAMVTVGTLGGGLSANAEQFYAVDNDSYNYLIEKYLTGENDTVFTVATYDKANTESNKKRMENWKYVFSYDEKDKNGKVSKGYTSISRDYWSVNNADAPKEGVKYILVMREVKENGKQWGTLMNIDAIEVTPKSTKNSDSKAESATKGCSDPNKKAVTTTIKRTGNVITKCIDK